MAGPWTERYRGSSHTMFSNSDSPYPWHVSKESSLGISSHYSLPPDPRYWDSDLYRVEPDDELHDPSGIGRDTERLKGFLSWRGLSNFGCIVVLILGLVALFLGYPLIASFLTLPLSKQGGFNIGGINATGQIPSMIGNWGVIDLHTPKEAYTRTSWADGSTQFQLVFSDEFNVDGRTFYPGDDPYWEADDLHYWATNNLEWYDPEAVTTANGSLVITLSRKENHDLHYQSGMVTTWNKFCFTGGYIEASVQLPGANNVLGFWPAVWAMGNLGRAGYGATLQGLWPYSYDACDVGTAPNQTINGQPVAATKNGDPYNKDRLSYLPGQRLSRCTCPGESHPGPLHSDGTLVGRAAPEIDIIEAQIEADQLIGQASQSAQWAPFDPSYMWKNTSDNLIISNTALSKLNTYVGGATQETSSVVTNTDPSAYELNGGGYSIYGFEYQPGYDSAYITWIANNLPAWTLRAPGLGSNAAVNISARPISQEPMYIIANLGMSENFGKIDFKHLTFPSSMRIDYIRVYQPSNAINIGCNPKNFPTAAYINTYIEAYTNPNLTTWTDDFKQPWPKNSLLNQC